MGNFVRLCLQSRWRPDALTEAQTCIGSVMPDWSALKQLPEAAGLGPLFYDTIRGRNLVPLGVEAELRNAYEMCAAASTLVLAQLETVVDELAHGQVRVIVLKGAALLGTVYANPFLRPMADIDLLVLREAVPAAIACMQAAGYRRAGLLESRPGVQLSYENETVLVQDGEGHLPVELHWGLFDSPYYQANMPQQWFWETSTAGFSPRIATLGPAAQILHLTGHLVLHHRGRGMLWWHDIAAACAYYKAVVDWDDLLERAQTFGLVLSLQQVLPHLVSDWGAPIPPAVLAHISSLKASAAERRAFSALTASKRPVVHRFLSDLWQMGDWGAGVRYALASLFPSADYMYKRYTIGHHVLLPLYYPLRLYLGVRGLFDKE